MRFFKEVNHYARKALIVYTFFVLFSSTSFSTFEVTIEGTTEVTSEFGNSTASPISDTAKSESGRTGQEIL